MFSHEGVELRESTVRNRYLTPPEKVGGGAGSKSSPEQVKKKKPTSTCKMHTWSTSLLTVAAIHKLKEVQI